MAPRRFISAASCSGSSSVADDFGSATTVQFAFATARRRLLSTRAWSPTICAQGCDPVSPGYSDTRAPFFRSDSIIGGDSGLDQGFLSSPSVPRIAILDLLKGYPQWLSALLIMSTI